MAGRNRERVEWLMDRGVAIPAPRGVEIGDEVDLERISAPGVILHTGTKIFGAKTLISRDVRLGYEGPVTVEDCCVGPEVALKGGFFKEAVFLKGASMGLGAQVRQGTILEEQASGAHTVALKQTILFPFVTLGSLINFCDCFMAGGTDRQNHSEVGSSYIHFNYTPNQDKATASMMGDVPNGVMLNQSPIFLGGQGGLVGPCRLAYGTVIAAGTVWRKDELRSRRLLFGGPKKDGNLPYRPGFYLDHKRTIKNNLLYIANLAALMQWYEQVRSLFVGNDFAFPLLEALKKTLFTGVCERIDRMDGLLRGFLELGDRDRKNDRRSNFYLRWPDLEAYLRETRRIEGNAQERDAFLARVETAIGQSGKDYLAVIKGLSPETATIGTRWLQGVADSIMERAMALLPGLSA